MNRRKKIAKILGVGCGAILSIMFLVWFVVFIPYSGRSIGNLFRHLAPPTTPVAVQDVQVPVYPGALFVSEKHGYRGDLFVDVSTRVYRTGDDPERVLSFYRTELERLRWLQDESAPKLGALGYHTNYGKWGQLFSLTVRASRDAEGTSIVIEVRRPHYM